MLQPDQQLGAYRIISQVGSGGMATVYKAYHERLERFVAVKVMHQAFLQDPNFHTRFAREAKIIARLDHPNIVSVYDYAEIDAQPYLVMKYVEGRTLKHVLFKRKLSHEEILSIVTPLADALDYAHRMGVLHRDIKPSNIILDAAGTPYLTDFGMARIAQTGESTISADMMLGTPQYISPEQALGKQDLDARTDLYSFGVVLYEMIVGQVPFSGDTPYAVIHDHIYRALPVPSSLNPAVPPAVESVLIKALAKEPGKRYGSAGEMIAALRDALQRGSAGQVVRQMTQPAPSVPAPLPANADAQPKRTVEFKIDLGSEDLNAELRRAGEELKKAGKEIGAAFQEVRGELQREFGSSKTARKQKTSEASRAWQGWQPSEEQREQWSNAGQQEDDDSLREMPDDEEDFLRRRIHKRIEARNGFIGHAAAYLMVNIALWSVFIFGQNGLENFLTPDGDFPWPLMVTLFWGAGFLANGVETFFRTGRRAVQRDRATLDALRARFGETWYAIASRKQYREMRRQATSASHKLEEFLSHLASYVMVNGGLWSIFVFSGGFAEGDGFPWPLFVSFFWGIGLVSHAAQTVGGFRRQQAIDRQVARELDREWEDAKPKRKNDRIRLTDDGELTDSMIDDIEAQERSRRGLR
jgi:serine/threonine protein kinase